MSVAGITVKTNDLPFVAVYSGINPYGTFSSADVVLLSGYIQDYEHIELPADASAGPDQEG